MSALARDAAALREPPAPPRAWTQEIDVLPARGVVMLYDFAGERALCAGALAGDDDPRGALVKAGPP